MAIPSRIIDRALVLSALKQAAFGTAVTDVNLQGGKRFAPNNPLFGQTDSSFYTNRQVSMKGHDYSTQRQEVQREYAEQVSFDGDSWLLAFIAAYVFGAVTSAQPNAGGNPTCYEHTIKPLDPSAAGKDLPITTVYIEANNSANWKRRMLDIAFRELMIEAPPGRPLQITSTMQGSGNYTSGVLAAQPALSAMNLLMSNDMSFLYGAQGGPADISNEIVAGSFKFGFNWGLDDNNAHAPGGGLYRSRHWVTTPSISMEWQRFVDDTASTPDDEWKAGTVKEVKVTIPGAQIGPGPEKHQIEIRGLAVVPEAVKLGQSGDKSCYQYSIGPDHWLKVGGADVVTVKVRNLQASYFV
jgi:hypothetical protein